MDLVWLLCLCSLLIYNVGFAFFVFQSPEATSAVRVPQTLDSSRCFLMFRVTLHTFVRSPAQVVSGISHPPHLEAPVSVCRVDLLGSQGRVCVRLFTIKGFFLCTESVFAHS